MGKKYADECTGLTMDIINTFSDDLKRVMIDIAMEVCWMFALLRPID